VAGKWKKIKRMTIEEMDGLLKKTLEESQCNQVCGNTSGRQRMALCDITEDREQ